MRQRGVALEPALEVSHAGVRLVPGARESLFGHEGAIADECRPHALAHRGFQVTGQRRPVGGRQGRVLRSEWVEQWPLLDRPRQQVVQFADHPLDVDGDGRMAVVKAAAQVGDEVIGPWAHRAPAGQHRVQDRTRRSGGARPPRAYSAVPSRPPPWWPTASVPRGPPRPCP